MGERVMRREIKGGASVEGKPRVEIVVTVEEGVEVDLSRLVVSGRNGKWWINGSFTTVAGEEDYVLVTHGSQVSDGARPATGEGLIGRTGNRPGGVGSS